MTGDSKEGGEAPAAASVTPPPAPKSAEAPAEQKQEEAEKKPEEAAKYNLKKTIDKSGAGFNQFDPVLSVTRCRLSIAFFRFCLAVSQRDSRDDGS